MNDYKSKSKQKLYVVAISSFIILVLWGIAVMTSINERSTFLQLWTQIKSNMMKDSSEAWILEITGVTSRIFGYFIAAGFITLLIVGSWHGCSCT